MKLMMVTNFLLLLHLTKVEGEACGEGKIRQIKVEYDECASSSIRQISRSLTTKVVGQVVCSAVMQLIHECGSMLDVCFTEQQVEDTKTKQRTGLEKVLAPHFSMEELKDCFSATTRGENVEAVTERTDNEYIEYPENDGEVTDSKVKDIDVPLSSVSIESSSVMTPTRAVASSTRRVSPKFNTSTRYIDTTTQSNDVSDTITQDTNVPENTKRDKTMLQTSTYDKNTSDNATHDKNISDTISLDKNLSDTITQDKNLPDTTTQDKNLSDTITDDKNLSYIITHEKNLSDTITHDKNLSDRKIPLHINTPNTKSQDTHKSDKTSHDTYVQDTTSQDTHMSDTTSHDTHVSGTTSHDTHLSHTTPHAIHMSDTTTHNTHVSDTTSHDVNISDTSTKPSMTSGTAPQIKEAVKTSNYVPIIPTSQLNVSVATTKTLQFLSRQSISKPSTVSSKVSDNLSTSLKVPESTTISNNRRRQETSAVTVLNKSSKLKPSPTHFKCEEEEIEETKQTYDLCANEKIRHITDWLAGTDREHEDDLCSAVRALLFECGAELGWCFSEDQVTETRKKQRAGLEAIITNQLSSSSLANCLEDKEMTQEEEEEKQEVEEQEEEEEQVNNEYLPDRQPKTLATKSSTMSSSKSWQCRQMLLFILLIVIWGITY